MDIYNMIGMLQIIHRLVARNRHIDQNSKGYREFKSGTESLIAALEAVVRPIEPLVAEPSPVAPGDTAPTQ